MILENILLGISLAAPIGPVSIEMINRGLKKGFWAAFIIRLGGCIGNILCLILAHFCLSSLLVYPLIINLISVTGAVFLIYMGFKNFLKKELNLIASNKLISMVEKNGLLVGFILSLANPVSIVFWLGIFAATINTPDAESSNFGLSLFIIIGVLIWGAFLSGVLALGNRFLKPPIILVITKIAGLVLVAFGIKYCWLSISKIFI